MRTFLLGLALLCSLGCRERESPSEPVEPAELSGSYLSRRAQAETKLRVHGPSPADYEQLILPPNVQQITYQSGDLELAAWVAWPHGVSEFNRVPAIVYFHGDFAFGADDFDVVRGWLEAGYGVMTPILRGENGNPGDFELLWGEVDDARAAVEWMAAQPQVDRSRVYAFGHSVGGGIAAMLSLYPELPLRRTGSVGGIYVPETFPRWARSKDNADLVRFDADDPRETQLRVLGPNVRWMVHEHVAFVGRDDPWFSSNAQQVLDAAWAEGKPFSVIEVDGDHTSSVAPALRAFLDIARFDLPR